MSYTDPRQNRRQSVRIGGRSLFFYQVVSPEKFAEIKKDFEAGISLYTQEHLLDLQAFIGAQKALSSIREKDSDLADFLQHLDMKINILLKKVSKGKTPLDRLKLKDINLSANGLAFITNEELAKGTFVEVQLAFLPTYNFVYGITSVTGCEKIKKADQKTFFRVSVKFELIMDDDRETLVQYNFKQQSLALRNRKKKQQQGKGS